MKPRNMMDVLLSEIKVIPVPAGIIALHAYGSIVHGKLRNDSDIDISMLPSFDTNDFERLQLLSKADAIVASVLNRMGIRREVSVLDMRGKYVSLQLLYRIITEGKLLYESAHKERIYFDHAVKREYFDFIPYLLFLRQRKYGDLYKKV